MNKDMTIYETIVELRLALTDAKRKLSETGAESILYPAYSKRVYALEMAIKLLREYAVIKELETRWHRRWRGVRCAPGTLYY